MDNTKVAMSQSLVGATNLRVSLLLIDRALKVSQDLSRSFPLRAIPRTLTTMFANAVNLNDFAMRGLRERPFS
jgi:hypothetical protein